MYKIPDYLPIEQEEQYLTLLYRKELNEET